MSTLARCPSCGAGKRVEADEAARYLPGGMTWGPPNVLRVECPCGEVFQVSPRDFDKKRGK